MAHVIVNYRHYCTSLGSARAACVASMPYTLSEAHQRAFASSPATALRVSYLQKHVGMRPFISFTAIFMFVCHSRTRTLLYLGAALYLAHSHSRCLHSRACAADATTCGLLPETQDQNCTARPCNNSSFIVQSLSVRTSTSSSCPIYFAP